MRNNKELGREKTSRLPIKIVPIESLKKPAWIKMKLPNTAEYMRVKNLLREQELHSVCEEASCPNIAECYSHGTATFMILGDLCTRRCPFCDVTHGKPKLPDDLEPLHLAKTISALQLKYVVITSVDRDDLRDGGASHFVKCINQIRRLNPNIVVEILVPDFRGRLDKAIDILFESPPNVFNHNLETIPRLYKQARPGADYLHSLNLLSTYKSKYPNVSTKSGLMLGLGETNDEIIEVMQDLRSHKVDMITLGQYLQPTEFHLPVARYVSPDEFESLKVVAEGLGFESVASGPMVRSSYHADLQAQGKAII